jgi:hypothetical protein
MEFLKPELTVDSFILGNMMSRELHASTASTNQRLVTFPGWILAARMEL